MQWQAVRTQYPLQWLVIEVLEADTEGHQRKILDLAVLAVCGDDFWKAWRHYQTLHKADAFREYLVVSTLPEELVVGMI